MLWSKLTIGRKIAVAFLLPLLILGGMSVWNFIVSEEILENVTMAKDESMVFASTAQAMAKDVVQVQQWLTDISATRGLDGLNDGFDEAENNYRAFLEKLAKFRTFYRASDNDERLSRVADLERRFEAYYAMGKKMAHAYVDGGPEMGNKMMGGFDTEAESLSSALEPFVAEQQANAASQMEAVYTLVSDFKHNIMLVSVVAIVFLVIVGYFLTKSISEPIIKTVAIIKEIAGGDFTRKIDVTSEDEVGVLGGALNSMVNELSSMFVNITDSAKTLVASSKEFAVVSSQLAGGSEEMSNQANAVAGATEQMTANINSMASAVEEASVNSSSVSSTAEQMSVNMRTIASAIEEMTVSINDVAKNAQDTAHVAGQATELSGSATKTMHTLGTSANEIGKVTEMIKRIAEQTNLLALNATIEAASAGDAGKGFAVVANEIKELANQSGQAAEDITDRIHGVQASTNEAVQVISDVADIIAKINESVEVITRSVNEQTKAANEIASNVNEVTNGANNIASAISEVAKGTSDISKNAGEAAKGTSEVSSNIQGISRAVTDSNDGIRQIDGSAHELSKIAGELQSMVARFKVGGQNGGVTRQLTKA